MPDLAAPAPPAVRVSAIEREVRWHRIVERALGGCSDELIADAEDPTPRRIGRDRRADAGVARGRSGRDACPPADRPARRTRQQGRPGQGARRRRARRPDGGAPKSPERASICLQSSDFARSAAKCISKCIQNERICRATRPGAPPRAGRRTAARRRPARVSICLQPSDLPRSGEKSISNCCHIERICRAKRAADADLGRRGARGGSRGQAGKGMSHRTERREAERPAPRSHAAVAPSGQGDCERSPRGDGAPSARRLANSARRVAQPIRWSVDHTALGRGRPPPLESGGPSRRPSRNADP